MAKPREILEQMTAGLGALGQSTVAPQMGAFMNYLGKANGEGAISVKNKELICVALGVYNRCEYCIVYHTYKALEAGATREELLEAGMVSTGFGGGPSICYASTLLLDSINEFEGDFKK